MTRSPEIRAGPGHVDREAGALRVLRKGNRTGWPASATARRSALSAKEALDLRAPRRTGEQRDFRGQAFPQNAQAAPQSIEGRCWRCQCAAASTARGTTVGRGRRPLSLDVRVAETPQRALTISKLIQVVHGGAPVGHSADHGVRLRARSNGTRVGR